MVNVYEREEIKWMPKRHKHTKLWPFSDRPLPADAITMHLKREVGFNYHATTQAFFRCVRAVAFTVTQKASVAQTETLLLPWHPPVLSQTLRYKKETKK